MPSPYRSDILFVFLLAMGLYVAYLARSVLLLIYVSALFAVVLSPALLAIQKVRLGGWRPGKGVAVVLLLAGGVALLTFLFAFAFPPIFRDARALAAEWPRHVASVGERLKDVPLAGNFDPASLQQYADEAVGGAFGLFAKVAGGVFWLFSWLILTVYFILDGERAFRWFLSMFSGSQRTRLEATLLRGRKRMSYWLIGQGALMILLGVVSAIVLGLLGVRYYYALAVFAGLANLIPVVGPVATIVVAGVVAAIDSWGKLAAVVGFYVAYQQVENAVLVPRIMQSTVDLPPLAVITALILGGALAGILGALVAVPSAALAAVLIDEYLVKKEVVEVPAE